jgi:CO/xanthine dehydrogenase Mo-binding subunit
MFGKTAVAHVGEVSVVNETIHVLRVASAVHCGLAVNPDNVRAQIEGAINHALTPVLHAKSASRTALFNRAISTIIRLRG